MHLRSRHLGKTRWAYMHHQGIFRIATCGAVLCGASSAAVGGRDAVEQFDACSHSRLFWHSVERRMSAVENGQAKTQTLCVLADSFSPGRGSFSFSPVMYCYFLHDCYKHGPFQDKARQYEILPPDSYSLDFQALGLVVRMNALVCFTCC